jgi:anaerobic magnesium-protoporphyrin IX monomethyl ester cyclase
VGGGVHFQICQEEISNETGFDWVCTGEGERTLLGIIDEYLLGERKSKTLAMIPNLYYKDDEKGWGRTYSWFADDLNQVPFPDYAEFNRAYYLRKRTFIPAVIAASASVMTSRGCPFMCSYCFNSFYSGRVRYYAIPLVVDYMKGLREQYGINHFAIMDDLFVMDKARVNEFCVEVLKRVPGIQWVCNARPNLLKDHDLSLLKLMRSAGCVQMSLGFESGSDEVLQRIRGAGSSVATNQQALEVISRSGINVFGYFMCGIPGETEAQMRMTGDFIDNNEALMRHYELFVYTPFPGSVLAGMVEKQGLLSGVSMKDLALNIFAQGTPRVFNALVSPDVVLAFRQEYKKKTMVKYSLKEKVQWLLFEGVDNPRRTMRRIMEIYGKRKTQ